jgi:hypothetical protein
VTTTEAAGGGAPTAVEARALDDALDHLLDPLADDPPSSIVAAPMPELVPVRTRWSDREVVRLTRRAAGWTVGLAAFVGTVWLILAVGPVR